MSLEFHPEAEEELAEAAFHYDREVEGLGGRFLAEIRRATLILGEQPRLGHRVDEQLSRLILRRFPYSLMLWIKTESLSSRSHITGGDQDTGGLASTANQ